MKMLKTTLFLLAVVFGSTLFSSETDRIKVVLNANEAPPFFSRDLPYNGMCGEIIHEISKASGLETEIRFKPLSRMIEEDEGSVIGDPAFFMASQDFSAIIPIALYHVAFYHYDPEHDDKIHLEINSLSDLGKSRIGILKGSLLEPLYFKSKGITFETSYTDDSLFKKLKLGRLDYVIAIELVGIHTIERLFPSHEEEFISFQIKNSVNPLAILLSEEENNGDLIAKKYKEGLNKILENGVYEKILEKYYESKEKVHADWYHDLKKFSKLYELEGNE